MAPDDDAKRAGTLPGDADLSTEVHPDADADLLLQQEHRGRTVLLLRQVGRRQQGQRSLVELADFWVFPPIVDLAVSLRPMGGFKPYVGAGVQYMCRSSAKDGKGIVARRTTSRSTTLSASRCRLVSTWKSVRAGT